MLCSYFGGLSIASSYVGIVHPLSAGLSTVFGTRHCEANCRVLFELNKYYPSYRKLFLKYVINNNIKFLIKLTKMTELWLETHPF